MIEFEVRRRLRPTFTIFASSAIRRSLCTVWGMLPTAVAIGERSAFRAVKLPGVACGEAAKYSLASVARVRGVVRHPRFSPSSLLSLLFNLALSLRSQTFLLFHSILCHASDEWVGAIARRSRQVLLGLMQQLSHCPLFAAQRCEIEFLIAFSVSGACSRSDDEALPLCHRHSHYLSWWRPRKTSTYENIR